MMRLSEQVQTVGQSWMLGLKGTAVNTIHRDNEDRVIATVVGPVLGPHNLLLLEGLDLLRKVPAPLPCCSVADLEDALSLLFGWTAFEKIKGHEEGISIDLFCIDFRFWNVRHLKILPHLSTHHWKRTTPWFEVLKAGCPANTLLATAVKPSEHKASPHHLIGCQNDHHFFADCPFARGGTR
jgi:hypothetical protein